MNAYPQHISLKSLVGSAAYGLSSTFSDTDYAGVFVEPAISFLGLNYKSINDSWSNSSPEGDDETYHEIVKFLNLCLKANPNMFEVLWSPLSFADEIGKLLLINRNRLFTPEDARENMCSFIRSSIHTLRGPEKHTDFKTFRTAYLKGYGILSWLKTGIYTFDALDLETSESMKTNSDGFTREHLTFILEELHGDLFGAIVSSELPVNGSRETATAILHQAREMYK